MLPSYLQAMVRCLQHTSARQHPATSHRAACAKLGSSSRPVDGPTDYPASSSCSRSRQEACSSSSRCRKKCTSCYCSPTTGCIWHAAAELCWVTSGRHSSTVQLEKRHNSSSAGTAGTTGRGRCCCRCCCSCGQRQRHCKPSSSTASVFGNGTAAAACLSCKPCRQEQQRVLQAAAQDSTATTWWQFGGLAGRSRHTAAGEPVAV
jgi:hypothetical protein